MDTSTPAMQRASMNLKKIERSKQARRHNSTT